MEIDLPVPAAIQTRYASGRYKTERFGRVVKAMVYGFRRCAKRDPRGNEYMVQVLAEIPSGFRCFVRREQWATEKLAWVNALVALRINAAALAAFLASGDAEWRAEMPV